MDEEQKRLAEELLFADERPSFAKMLFFGLFDAHRVMPYPEINPEEKEKVFSFIDKLNSYCDNNLDPDKIDRDAEIPREVILGLGELGLLGMTIPENFGGKGYTQYGYCKAMETLAPRCASTALFVNAHQSIGLKAFLLFGTKEQQEKYLPKLSTGEHVAAFALTEPNVGSDASAVETTATYDAEKKVYRINGKKKWITNGSFADVLTVMAQSEVDTPKGKQQKITAFIVTPDMKGFRVVENGLEKVGMRGTKTAVLEFNDVEVPEENVLGPKGGGLRVCLTCLDFGRITFGSTCTGVAKFLLEKAVDRAKTRFQFNRPLGSFELVKEKLANMAALVYAMDATTFLTAGLIDRDEEDIMLEAAILKVFTSDAVWDILYDTMQIYGGASFFTSEPFERMMRDARLNMIGEGSNEVLRAFIGAVGMRDVGMQLKGVVDSLKNPVKGFSTLWSFGKGSIKRLCAPTVPVRNAAIKSEATKLSYIIQRFGNSIPGILAKYREEIVERQFELDRISTAAMAIYTTTAVLAKIDADLSKHNGDASQLNDLETAKFYCHQALKQAEHALDSLYDSDDQKVTSLADKLTGIKHS